MTITHSQLLQCQRHSYSNKNTQLLIPHRELQFYRHNRISVTFLLFYTNTILFPRVSNGSLFHGLLSRQLFSVLSETYCPDILAVQFPFVARSSTLSDSRLRSNFSSSNQLTGMHKRLRRGPGGCEVVSVHANTFWGIKCHSAASSSFFCLSYMICSDSQCHQQLCTFCKLTKTTH